MKILITMSMLLFGGLAYANPLVTQGTDIGYRQVESHHQVTRCAVGEAHCTTNSVTKFDKPMLPLSYYGECNYVDDGKKTYQHCKLTGKKPKAKVKIKKVIVKKVVRVIKKNRLQLHLGAGPTGLSQESNNNKTVVGEKMDVVMGGSYSRALNETYSVGASVFSNKTATISFGFDY